MITQNHFCQKPVDIKKVKNIFFLKNHTKFVQANRVFFKDRATRKDLNSYRKFIESELLLDILNVLVIHEHLVCA